jgi:hypothetical protein
MKERRSFITEETIISGDEDVLKVKIQKLALELFVDYVNNKYGYTVLEIVTENRR